MASIYKTPGGEAALMVLYDRALAGLGLPPVVGMSYGAGIVRRLAGYASRPAHPHPRRIRSINETILQLLEWSVVP